jgi:hypothetical protein
MLFLKKRDREPLLPLSSAKVNIHYPDAAMSYDERENVKRMILR